MSSHIICQESFPQSSIEFNYDYSDIQQEPVIRQQDSSKGGFKRRTINQQNHESPTVKNNSNTRVLDLSEPITVNENPNSGYFVVNFADKPNFGQSSEYSSLQTLKSIISEAKQAERYFLAGDKKNYEDDNSIKAKNDEEHGFTDYYSENDTRLDKIPSKVRKTSNKGLEIDFTEESVDKENHYLAEQEIKSPTTSNVDGLAHSKSSYLTGPVRYSKMPEEEAATIFEQRRKELLESLSKKGKRKNLKIFQDLEASSARVCTTLESQINSAKDKPTSVTGFVIFNTRKESLGKSRGLESPSSKKTENKEPALRKSAILNRNPKRTSSPLVKNKIKKDADIPVSPNKNGIVTSKPKQLDRSEIQKKEGSKECKEIKNIKKEEVSNKISVDWKTLKYGMNKNLKQNPTAKGEENNKNKRETFSKTQESEDYSETKGIEFSPKPSLPRKTQEIWADIENLDNQIQQLETAKTPTAQKVNENNYLQEGSNKDTAYLFKKKSKGNAEASMLAKSNDNKPPSRNATPIDTRGSDRYKLDSEDFFIDNETDNEYNRYSMERIKTESPRLNYRKSPINNSALMNRDSLSFRNENKKNLNRSEYLYQKGLEQKEAKQYQIEKYIKEKETAELSSCTFFPNIQTRSFENMDDFETRTKNWQLNKEKKLQEIEKIKMEKEMEQCSFFPQTATKKDEKMRFDSNEFYQRNLEWKKRIETEDMQKQNENINFLTLSTDKLQGRSSTQSYSNGFFRQKSPEIKEETPSSSRSYAKRWVQENKKPQEVETVRAFVLNTDSNRIKSRPTEAIQSQINTLEDDFLKKNEYKRIENWVESADLADIFNRENNSSKIDKHRVINQKGPSQGIQEVSKTLQDKSKAKGSKIINTASLSTLKDTFSTKQAPLSANNNNYKKSNNDNLNTYSNKLPLDQKFKQVDLKNASKESRLSIDKKDEVSHGYNNQSHRSKQKNETLGNYFLAYTPQNDQENRTYKKKPLFNGNQSSPTPTDLFEDKNIHRQVEKTAPLATRQLNIISESSENQKSYVRRNTTKDIASSFEKNFYEFVDQMHKMIQESDQPNLEKNSSQNDNSRKRRTNFSLH